MDFSIGVHHKRAVPHNRLVDGLTAQDQQHRIVIGLKTDLRAVAGKQCHLPFAHHFLAIDLDRSVQHHQHGVAALVQIERGRLARVQADIPHIDWRKGPRRAPLAIELAGNQAQAPGIILKRQLRNLAIHNALVARLGHLVLGRQVDPQLDHLQRAATASKRLGVELFVQDPRRSGHPLHITGPDDPAVTGGIPMLDFTFVDDGHRLKPAMGMLAYTTPPGGGRELGGPCVIKQQERADVLTHTVVGKQRPNRKAIADPVRTWGRIHTQNVFHVAPPVNHGNKDRFVSPIRLDRTHNTQRSTHRTTTSPSQPVGASLLASCCPPRTHSKINGLKSSRASSLLQGLGVGA